MKTKVLKYKFDGNTIVAPYMELEPYAENVFISLARKNEYGNESEDCFHVICKIGDVHFSCGQYSRRILDKEGHREEASAYCKNWIENTLKDVENGKIIPLLSVHVFNALGLDSTPLVQARETYAKRQEEKRLEREKKEEQEKTAQSVRLRRTESQTETAKTVKKSSAGRIALYAIGLVALWLALRSIGKRLL